MTAIRILSKCKRAWLLARTAHVNHIARIGVIWALLFIAPVHAQDEETFDAWRESFINRAVDEGYDRELAAATLSGVEPLMSTIELDRDQPEFVRPVWEYLDSAVSQSRQDTGGALLLEEAELLAAIETRWGVDRAPLVAIWGLESAFGAQIGNTDVVQALATLAWDGRRRELFERELLAVLQIIQSGAAERDELIGGWAGAMGQTQFMPTTFVQYAVDYDQDGRKDVWAHRGDALGSAANYLHRYKWKRGEPWGVEVRLPDGFNYALADGRRKAVSAWAERGITRMDGQPWPAARAQVSAKLLLPAGANGPAFLTYPNFDVIKKYNNSTAYALGVSLLSDRLAGKPGVQASWPRRTQMLNRTGIMSLQRALRALGYDPKGVDGRVGPNTQAALRAWQTANNLPADAFATQDLLDAVRAQL